MATLYYLRIADCCDVPYHHRRVLVVVEMVNSI